MSAKRKPNRHGIAANKTAAAARLGIITATITAAQRAGCPACKPNGRIDCDALEIWLTENGASVTADGGTLDYNHERSLKIQVERKIKEVHLAIKIRELIDVDEARASVTRLIAAAKGQFLSLGANIAPLVMVKIGLTKAQADQLRELIDNRTRAIVTNLTNNPWNPKPSSLPAPKKPRKRSSSRKAATPRKSSKTSPAKPGE
tara:strand:+ start:48 stop:656 length:609 start_codon:yes stop_codon:yes gene_type:complete